MTSTKCSAAFSERRATRSNHDRRLDRNDARFGELLLWRDANSDGVTQDGELLTLADASIHSIDLNYSRSTLVDHGNLIGEVSSASSSHGELFVGDVYFQHERQRPVPLTPQTVGTEASDGSIDHNAHPAVGHADVLQPQPGIAREQLWFSQLGAGDGSKMVDRGRMSTPLHMESTTAGVGGLFDAQVANLVQSMASMTQPLVGHIALLEAPRNPQVPALAANWG